jgi:2-keto-4-pentenoate hydratase/2-oxohepta-3-ene-1,7-dioic acid hydratase in catechol pathway
MKFCRFVLQGQSHYGLIESSAGRDVITRILLKTPQEVGRDLDDVPTRRMQALDLYEAELLPPVEPTKIVCVGRNYREHAEELGNEVPSEPLLFFKPPSSLLGAGQTIRRPKLSERVDYEGELAVVIGRRCHNIGSDEDSRAYILGYTCLNDVTARDLQNKDNQWTRAKGFDSFCPVGPLVTDEVNPWNGVGVETRVNDEVRQQGNTRDFIFSLGMILRFITQAMTLMPGDIVATGTPKGVGPLVAGDIVDVSVEGVGTLRNKVEDE